MRFVCNAKSFLAVSSVGSLPLSLALLAPSLWVRDPCSLLSRIAPPVAVLLALCSQHYSNLQSPQSDRSPCRIATVVEASVRDLTLQSPQSDRSPCREALNGLIKLAQRILQS